MSKDLFANDNIDKITGVGPRKRDSLNSIGIFTVADLLSHIPFRYRDRRKAVKSASASGDTDLLIEGSLIRKNVHSLRGNKTVVECSFRDDSGIFGAAFFGMPYLMKTLKLGSDYALFGKMKRRNGLALWTNPEICELGSEADFRGILPVYRCTKGISNRDLSKWITSILDNLSLDEWLSSDLLSDYRLCDTNFAYRNIHFPQGEREYRVAKYRLDFDELLVYLVAMGKNRMKLSDSSLDSSIENVDVKPFVESLAFKLTDGQKSAIEDIEADLIKPAPMNRMIQGDVGCGKTVVAAAAIYKTCVAGHQAAYMAPTEILARQHYRSMCDLFKEHGITVGLITSGMKQSERKSLLANLSNGDIDLLVGTHALISEGVEFNDLSLVITDEQHRFGVNQRRALAEKGRLVNTIVMSATPIPRTLASTVFGDMDFSIIKGRPSGRKEIITKAIAPDSRARAYASVRKELEKGQRAYVVAPSIDSDDEDISSVFRLYEELSEDFREYGVELLHGRMSKEEKDKVMNAFASGKVSVLVATTVVEVGIDVPEASIIVIENSERFGLAQLHQLRGRVGRSDIQSYCFLINYSKSESSRERMDAMVRLSDGFEISEADYRLRGPGDVMGTMQHGMFGNKLMRLCENEKLLDAALEASDRIIRSIATEAPACDEGELERRLRRISGSDNREII